MQANSTMVSCREQHSNSLQSAQCYLSSLDRPREIRLNGEKYMHPQEIPSLRQSISMAARFYDVLGHKEADGTYALLRESRIGDSNVTSHSLFLPHDNAEDLARSERAVEHFSREHFGLMTRPPDYKGSFVLSLMMTQHQEAYQDNARFWYDKMARELPYVSHAFVAPTAWSASKDNKLGLTVLDEGPDGIVVRGLKAVCTSSAISQYLFVRELEVDSESYRNLSFMLDSTSEGLTHICTGAGPDNAAAGSHRRNPISSFMSEFDHVLAFNDVFIPKQNILSVWDAPEPPATEQDVGFIEFARMHGCVRLRVKLEFLYGVLFRAGRYVSQRNYDELRLILSDVAMTIEILKSLSQSMRDNCSATQSGHVLPSAIHGVIYQNISCEVLRKLSNSISAAFAKGIVSVPSTIDDLCSGDVDLTEYLRMDRETVDSAFTDIRALSELIGENFGTRSMFFEENYLSGNKKGRRDMYETFSQSESCEFIHDWTQGFFDGLEQGSRSV